MIELVWDGRDAGTIVAADGSILEAGPLSAFSPGDLLAGAAAASLMRAFLVLAREADLGLLGFVAAAAVEGPMTDPRVRLRVLVTVNGRGRGSPDRRSKALLRQAKGGAIACRALGRRLVFETEVRQVAAT
jgi:organic hydroperoxide reductase OsmC/OhrA